MSSILPSDGTIVVYWDKDAAIITMISVIVLVVVLTCFCFVCVGILRKCCNFVVEKCLESEPECQQCKILAVQQKSQPVNIVISTKEPMPIQQEKKTSNPFDNEDLSESKNDRQSITKNNSDSKMRDKNEQSDCFPPQSPPPPPPNKFKSHSNDKMPQSISLKQQQRKQNFNYSRLDN